MCRLAPLRGIHGQNEVLFDQPVILNGIEDLVTRSPVNTFDLRFVHTK
jgi:hypothetical protein